MPWKEIVTTRAYQPMSTIRSVVKVARYVFTRRTDSDRLPSALPLNVYIARTDNVWFFLKETSDAGLQIFRVSYTGGGPARRR